MNTVVYQCTKCEWVGADAACTEQKVVEFDNSVRRSWHPLCPKCFKPARYYAITNRDCDAAARMKLHADMETEEEAPIPLHIRRLRKDHEWALHSARVHRERAHSSAITRRFWFIAAHDDIHRARVIRARLRSEGVQP
jgi:hypothetical protein